MRKPFALLALVAGAATGVQGQQAWQTEIGIRGGFARQKPSGTGASDHSDLFTIPGVSVASALASPPTLFVVIPASPKIALEPSVTFLQLTVGGAAQDVVSLGLRGNYALTSKFYAAADVGLNYVDVFGTNDHQFGVGAAVGYRLRLTGRLNGRVEASWSTWAKTDNSEPYNLYAVQFALSAPLRRAAPPARRAATARAWQRVVGISGGYWKAHQVGGGDLVAFSAPGVTSVLNSTGAGAAPTLFASFPVGGKWAVEPGIDLLRLQETGTTTTVGQLTARVAYAVTGGWYAAGGAHLIYGRETGSDAASVIGANVAWGYRFALVGDLGGRVEGSYFLTPQNDDLRALTLFGATNTVGFTVALTMPLK